MNQVANSLRTCLTEFSQQVQLEAGSIFVVGCSTSEVIGKKIGTAGTTDIAVQLFNELQHFAQDTNVYLAFQCCEHINRALVVERSVAKEYGLEIVSAIPNPSAGGSLPAYAFSQLTDPVLVENIQAANGIDIGDTFIGMHLKQVAVPIRTSVCEIGEAHVTTATTRPKLVGGARTTY